MNMKKRILSGVMAVATMASIVSAVPANANAISGRDLNAHVKYNSGTSRSVTIDWDDYPKSYAGLSSQEKFRVEYHIQVIDLTPGKGKNQENTINTTVYSSEYKTTGLRPGHKYQFMISTQYFRIANNKTYAYYGGTNFTYYTTPLEPLKSDSCSCNLDYADKRQVGTYGTYGNSTYYAYGMNFLFDYGHGDVVIKISPVANKGHNGLYEDLPPIEKNLIPIIGMLLVAIRRYLIVHRQHRQSNGLNPNILISTYMQKVLLIHT